MILEITPIASQVVLFRCSSPPFIGRVPHAPLLGVGAAAYPGFPGRSPPVRTVPDACRAPAPAEATAAAPAPAMRFTGYIQGRETYRDNVGLTGSINRARISAYGTAAKDVTWRIQGEFRTGSVGTNKASVSACSSPRRRSSSEGVTALMAEAAAAGGCDEYRALRDAPAAHRSHEWRTEGRTSLGWAPGWSFSDPRGVGARR